MFVDGHEDIAYNRLTLGRDFTQSARATRAREGVPPADIGVCTTSLPDLLAGGVGVVFATLFTLPTTATNTSIATELGYRTPDEAHARAFAQLQYYRELAERPDVRLVTSRADLDAVRAGWTAGAPQLGLVPLMENADPIRTPDEAAWWYEQGLRIVGPAWHATRYCGGTNAPGPLTELGRDLMRELGRTRLVLDISHLAEESFWQALDLFDGTLIATHSNCRALLPNSRRADRHLSDAMIRVMLERDAVIGTVPYGRFLRDDWIPERGKAALGLDDLLRHIDHICQLAGDARHVAFGSDFDGGFGSDAIPREIDTAADMPRLREALLAAGYHAADTDNIMGGNWLRVLESTLP
ncbi:MAG: membrane dipeptidase [Chloroflexales bacterium]|nr:membrane dipeptidase [Chloroflexales bacterium]